MTQQRRPLVNICLQRGAAAARPARQGIDASRFLRSLGATGQRVNRLLERHPELMLGASSVPLGLLLLDLLHRAEQQLAALDADHADAHWVVVDLVGFLADELLHVLHRLGGEPDGAAAVHGRRRGALLEVARHTVSGLELALAGFGNHLCDHLYGVGLAGLLVDEDDLSGARDALVLPKDRGQVVDVAVKHLQVDAVLGCVDGERTDRETGDGGNVTGFTTLCFDDEDTATRGGGGLTAGIGVLNEGIQACV